MEESEVSKSEYEGMWTGKGLAKGIIDSQCPRQALYGWCPGSLFSDIFYSSFYSVAHPRKYI